MLSPIELHEYHDISLRTTYMTSSTLYVPAGQLHIKYAPRRFEVKPGIEASHSSVSRLRERGSPCDELCLLPRPSTSR